MFDVAAALENQPLPAGQHALSKGYDHCGPRDWGLHDHGPSRSRTHRIRCRQLCARQREASARACRKSADYCRISRYRRRAGRSATWQPLLVLRTASENQSGTDDRLPDDCTGTATLERQCPQHYAQPHGIATTATQGTSSINMFKELGTTRIDVTLSKP